MSPSVEITANSNARLHKSDSAPSKANAYFRLAPTKWMSLKEAVREYGQLRIKGFVVDIEVELENGETHMLSASEIEKYIHQKW